MRSPQQELRGRALLALLGSLLALCLGAAGPQGVALAGPSAVSTVGSGPVLRCGTQLCVAGRPYRFTGVNAYDLATWWAVNAGCGAQVDDLEGLFRSLPAGSVVRFSAFQAQAVDKVSRRLDFTGIDRVVAAAEATGQRLALVLEDQAGACDDGHWKDLAWYRGGFRQRYDDDGRGLTPLSHVDWVRAVVSRYRGSPAVALWEPIGEPEASNCLGATGSACFGRSTCPPGAAAALRHYFDAVGGLVHRLDPTHLVGSAALGGGECGLAGSQYAYVHASPGIDVGSYHDYGDEGTAVPARMRTRIGQLHRLGKPFVAEETGIAAGDGPGCRSAAERAVLGAAKARAALAAGAAGFLPWMAALSPSSPCSYDVLPGDPYLAALAGLPVSGRR